MALRIFARINRMWLMLAAAIVLGLLATWLAVNYLKTREQRISEEIKARQAGGPTTAVVVPTRDLPRGTSLTEAVVAARPIASDLVYEDMITAEQFDKIAGKRLLRAVQQGRALRRADLFDERGKDFSDNIEPGLRAITVETDELNSISQMLRPGNLVDLYLIAAETNGTGQQVLPLLERVKVVATGQILRGADEPNALPTQQVPGQAAGYTTVTVEVTPEEAARIALAQQSGRIRAVLRNPKDDKDGDFGRVTTASLMRSGGGKAGPGGAEASVEFIIGGKGGGAGSPVNINIPSITIPGVTPPGVAAGTAPGTTPAAASSPQQSPLFQGIPAQAQGYLPNNVPTGAAGAR